jgi:hypothetical protein
MPGSTRIDRITIGGLRVVVAPDAFHVPVPRTVRLDQVFRLETTRTVSKDWVVRYDSRFFQIERQSRRPAARSSVQVFEAADGQVEIRYRTSGCAIIRSRRRRSRPDEALRRARSSRRRLSAKAQPRPSASGRSRIIAGGR